MNRMYRMISVFCLTACSASAAVWAQDYPARPIRLVVPYAAGGVTDRIARGVAKKMAEGLKQPVVVDNRTGAGGNIGADIVAKSAADGYTLLFATNGPLAANKSLYAKLSYDPERDFAPITLLASVPYILAVNPTLPVNSVESLVRFLKQHPGEFNYASGGTGTAQHFAGGLFKAMAGVDIGHVAYKGEAPALADVLGGHVPMLFASIPAIVPHLKTSRLHALAMTSTKRNALLPELPTLSESGLSGYSVEPWFALAGPAGLAPETVEKINAAAVAGLKSDEMKQMLASIGGTAVGNSPAEFAAFIRTEIPRWASLVKQSGATAE
ncbi:Bug family tripartite tricarboxylate transporter substrate binding protein [Noviherbaspirillum suwonense]|uniref:Tripartite-type tricarboxylate transporter, receptor component TctC n=1 Tax=Noviherbaspirillum suwonense TaxID=1224511 RepID=A0ABY1QVZ3_9BURK|nr:tripartite tricarboxylate transporter substrate binding protein [Noviherbaspirillum suwonense]SMP81791.1 Tripartite-type tricarboxylate transporter, receptor component TctC [Noviherbaspirillum suwonense]